MVSMDTTASTQLLTVTGILAETEERALRKEALVTVFALKHSLVSDARKIEMNALVHRVLAQHAA